MSAGRAEGSAKVRAHCTAGESVNRLSDFTNMSCIFRLSKNIFFRFYLTNCTQCTQETPKYTHTRIIALQKIEFYHEIYVNELYRIRFIAVLNLRELV